MDSLVTAALAQKESSEICFMHVNYGQKTEKKEVECFEKLCTYYNPEKSIIVNMDWLGSIGGSALTSNDIEIDTASSSDSVPLTYVPFRNANLICAAVSWAEVIGADKIYLGAVEEDSSGYPDCREIFIKYMQKVVESGTATTNQIKIITPVIHMMKSKIVEIGISMQVPFEYSWSCYKNSIKACGICASCKLRLKAFQKAGLIDPIPYEEGENDKT